MARFRNGFLKGRKKCVLLRKSGAVFCSQFKPEIASDKEWKPSPASILFPRVGKEFVKRQIFEQSAYALFSSHMVWFQVSHFSKIRRTWCLHYLLLRFTVMLGNILPLTGLCVVWYLIIKARGDVFYSEIKRYERADPSNDIFTRNEYCNNCSSFGADEHHTGHCECKKGNPSDSLFLRSERRCKSGKEFKGEWTVFIYLSIAVTARSQYFNMP